MNTSHSVVIKNDVDREDMKLLTSFIFDTPESDILIFNIYDDVNLDENLLFCMVSLLKGDVFCELFFTNTPNTSPDIFLSKLKKWTLDNEIIFYVSDFNSECDDGCFHRIENGNVTREYLSMDGDDNCFFN
ncbi:hypothetical protein [Acinetobacter junii]|jgi:hypothetical protein|uniref:hypothetical protein n=1 Tax=Acinetobacter junii TaxID=40215 RepID=UPI0002CE6E92|nr:hypothetical protein [Acinetobacter junii]ENV63890.1 hypothetical protein F949_01271 [Acinetobacter junii NIPH 182]MBJ8439972.1 hypothetical protein [Acinetobacter junii]UOB53308.1 hypothetical protein MRY16_04925 [Acinetobacter junii]